MAMLVNLFNSLLDFWVGTSWYLALMLSTLVNALVFVVTAGCVDRLTQVVVATNAIGDYIDSRPIKSKQKLQELRFGLASCFLFAIGSLLTRILYTDIWPSSFLSLIVQVLAFSLFYETYSYFIHRFLHLGALRKVHGVHHSSVRVTPWSAYSVHPIEAVLIAASAPFFMLIFPLSLGVALVLHVIGMMFTIIIHSNFVFRSNGLVPSMFNGYTLYHRHHHSSGNTNFGFTSPFWDTLFHTRYKG